MPDERPKSSFRDIYREQYRQITASQPVRYSWAFRAITLAVILIGALIGTRAPVVFTIVVAVGGVVLVVASVLLGRRQRRKKGSG